MFRNILWCYIFILTLLDLPLNTKLTAQGESHGVTIHDSLVEGITFQEWDAEAGSGAQGVSLRPRALAFGRAALGAPHARTVTLTNAANATLHLASVAGTTPDFHASFFESKTLPPQGNTSFSVVYLGRREGPVSAHLYIHTSLGVHKYPVSAVGVASEYEVWPLVGLRVPLNASVEPELTLYNPSDGALQVSEVYSTAAWLRLRLPAGGPRAPRSAWSVPPRSTRALVRLRVAPPAHRTQPLTAYIRVKANIPGGGLLVAVEARAAAAGEYARPPHVRLRPRGANDTPYTVDLELANSGGAELSLEGVLSGAGCWRGAPPEPCAASPNMRANGGAAAGAHLSLLRSQLAPHQDFVKAAQLTLNFDELWAASGAGAEDAWCAGCVRLGRAHVPYSVQLLPGALRFTPPHLDVVTAGEAPFREHELRAHNEFQRPLRLLALEVPPLAAQHLHVTSHTPLSLAAGAAGAVATLRLRAPAPPPALALAAALTLHTDLARYSVPLRVYSGKLLFEWDWANATEDTLELGAVGTSATRRVGVRLRNPAPVPLCVAALTAHLPGAAASFARAAPAAECIEGGAWSQAWLTVVAPAREGALRGELRLDTALAATRAALALHVRAGHVRLLPLRLPPAAPYAGAWGELHADSSMAVRMRVTRLEAAPPDPALAFAWEGAGYGELRAGRTRVARARLRPERRCEPRCYCGLSLATDEGAAWLARGAAWDAAALRDDLTLLRARLALFEQQRAQAPANFTIHMHTTEVVQVASSGSAALLWPRLAAAGAGAAPLCAVRRAVTLRLALRSPAHAPLLLQALLGAPHELPAAAGGERCARCAWAAEAWRVAGWRVLRGAAAPHEAAPPHNASAALPLLLLAPHTELEVSVEFAPPRAGSYAAYLYLRNNLTILEGVQLYGEGEYPSFELAGRSPGDAAPFVFEVKECWWGEGAGGAEGGAGGVVRRVLARNAGRVPVSLARWRVAGAACGARGFSVRECRALALAPNASAPLHLAFAADYSLAHVAAPLQLHSELGVAEFTLVGTVPAKVLAKCAAAAPRPPWEAALRLAGLAVAFVTFALVLAAAALDAERLLRRARAARGPAAPRAPLDLNALDAPAPAPAPPPRAARRRRAARRVLPALDPRAERRAFERWRAEVLRREDDSSRSSDDDDDDPAGDAPVLPLDRLRHAPPEPRPDAEEDAASSGSDDSTPPEERDDEPYSADVDERTDARDDSPAEEERRPAAEPARTPSADSAARASGAACGATVRARRDAAAEGARRSERVRGEAERRSAPARHHVRKERAGKRRSERVPPTPPPRSPAPLPPPAAPDAGVGAESRSAAGGTGSGAGGAGGGVRWGSSSWSAVVAGGGALAPIGSDVRRREPERAHAPHAAHAAHAALPADNSLFYFNGSANDADYPWRPAAAAPPPAPERTPFVPAARDYLEARTLGAGGVPFAGGASVWGGWGAWPAAAAPVRPPPGFAAPAPAAAPAPPEPRTYDPFRSLASIWAPAPNDWRAAPAPDDDCN